MVKKAGEKISKNIYLENQRKPLKNLVFADFLRTLSRYYETCGHIKTHQGLFVALIATNSPWGFVKVYVLVILLSVHAEQELLVAASLLELILEELHCFVWSHVGKMLTENPHAVESSAVEEEVITTCR